MVKLKFYESTFNWEVNLLFCPYSDLADYFKNEDWDKEEEYLWNPAMCFFSSKLKMITLWFNTEYTNDIATFSETLSHEILHAVINLKEKYQITSDEVICMLHSNLMEKSYKKVIAYQKKHKISNVSNMKG